MWKGILVGSEGSPRGLLDPVWWRKRKCMIVRATAANGVTKWMAKNRVSVALSTANPPQTHSTKAVPA